MSDISSRFVSKWHWIFSSVTILSILISIYTGEIYFAGIPLLILTGFLSVVDFSKIYFALLFFLPLSIQYFFPNGFSTDLPTEPLMILLTGVYFVYILTRPEKIDKQFFNHSIVILLFAHLSWMVVSVLYSSGVMLSLKYLLAKIWYVVPFVLITSLLLREKKEIGIAFWCIFLPLLLAVIQTIIRHSLTGFDFDFINKSVVPFFMNHVNYAAMLSVVLPHIWFARQFYEKKSKTRIFLNFSMIVFLIGIYFSYTRTAWIAVVILPFAYLAIEKKLLKWLVAVSFGIILLCLVYLGYNNEYLRYAPQYEKTIVQHNIKDQLAATYSMTDVSGMERVYRWVAAIRMSFDKPVVGYGPNNFYSFYKKYTVSSFTTYVSDNPEKSTTHNYFLMILVEQGYVGLIIFIAFTIFIFIKGDQIYHECKDIIRKRIIISCLLSLVAIYANLMLSDLIEMDKIGSLFFINIALLVNHDVLNKKTLKKFPAY